MEPGTDNILLQRIKRDDRLALNELFGIYYTGLCRFGASYVTLSESEELVSDLFVKLWQQRKNINIEKSVRSYLFASVKYACFRLASSKKISLIDVNESDHHSEFLSGDDPYESLIADEFQAHISKSLLKIPPRCRRVFIMNRYDGLKYKEIAAILSISEKTVENQIAKALQLMREQLLNYEKA